MKMIENLYENIDLEDFLKEDSEEYINAVNLIDNFLNKNISLERKQEIELQDLILINRCAAQKQGFELGFKYAVQMMKEVYQG